MVRMGSLGTHALIQPLFTPPPTLSLSHAQPAAAFTADRKSRTGCLLLTLMNTSTLADNAVVFSFSARRLFQFSI